MGVRCQVKHPNWALSMICVPTPPGMDLFHLENTTPLGMAAHDLRHPAAALVTYSELLAEATGPEARGEQLALIDSIHSVSDFLLRLLDDALELAHAESGTAQLRTVRSIVTDIVAQCASDEPAPGRPKADASQLYPTG